MFLAREAGVFLARDSGREHKAWGASPRITNQKHIEAREAADSLKWSTLSPASRARASFINQILGLAPQALCRRPLSRALKLGRRPLSRAPKRGPIAGS